MPGVPSTAEKKILIHLTTLQQILHTPESAELIFRALEKIGFELNFCNIKEPVNIPFVAEDAKKLWVDGTTYVCPRYTSVGNIFLAKHSKPRIDLIVTWRKSTDIDCLSTIQISMMKNQFAKNCAEFIWLFHYLVETFTPVFAFIGTKSSAYRQLGAPWAKIPGVYWLNYFGKEYLEFIGMQHILDCNWHQTKQLADGLLAWSTHDIMLSDDEFVPIENNYRQSLGLRYFSSPSSRYSEEAPPVLMTLRKQILG